jgi:hypothetical protein
MITYKSRFLAHGEVWFDNEPDETRRVDWITYHQRPRPVPGAKSRYFYTYVIDLNQSEEQLVTRLNRDTAYKIRRARERDKITCEFLDPNDAAVMDRFEQMYNTFAAMKGLRPLYRARTEGFAAAGVLDLRAARDPQGEVLVYHANYRDRSRATGLELPSLYRASADSAERNRVGRANRYLVWSGILHYKEQGLQQFDFGGWYHGTDPAMLRINEFKRGFGGEVQRGYECEQVLTLKGRLVMLAAAVLDRVKGRGTPLRPAPQRWAPTVDSTDVGATARGLPAYDETTALRG